MQLPHEMKHFPLFNHGISAQSECPASRQAGSNIGDVSTASSLAIGSQHTRGIQYVYTDCVLLRLSAASMVNKVLTLTSTITLTGEVPNNSPLWRILT